MILKGYLGPIDTDCAGSVWKFIGIIYCRTCFEIDDRAFDWICKILLLSDRPSLRSIECDEVWNRNFILRFFRNFVIEFVTLLRLHAASEILGKIHLKLSSRKREETFRGSSVWWTATNLTVQKQSINSKGPWIKSSFSTSPRRFLVHKSIWGTLSLFSASRQHRDGEKFHSPDQ